MATLYDQGLHAEPTQSELSKLFRSEIMPDSEGFLKTGKALQGTSKSLLRLRPAVAFKYDPVAKPELFSGVNVDDHKTPVDMQPKTYMWFDGTYDDAKKAYEIDHNVFEPPVLFKLKSDVEKFDDDSRGGSYISQALGGYFLDEKMRREIQAREALQRYGLTEEEILKVESQQRVERALEHAKRSKSSMVFHGGNESIKLAIAEMERERIASNELNTDALHEEYSSVRRGRRSFATTRRVGGIRPPTSGSYPVSADTAPAGVGRVLVAGYSRSAPRTARAGAGAGAGLGEDSDHLPQMGLPSEYASASASARRGKPRVAGTPSQSISSYFRQPPGSQDEPPGEPPTNA
jgi:hypothetical protein